MKTVIKNGTIINTEGSFIGDILIEDGKIESIGINIDIDNCSVIDAKNKLVLPGGIDVHTHMDLDLGKYRAIDDFYTGTVAAAFGGTTTIVDHIAFGPEGCSLNYMIDKYYELAEGKAVIDYSFHGVFQHVNEEVLKEMEKLVEEGISSFKIYMTYDNRLNDEDILKILIKAKELGAVIAVHAENHGAIQHLREYYGSLGKSKPIYHALSRPDSTEAEAINRMIYLSEIAGCPHLYFVHVSTKKGLDEIISARRRGVKNIYCETCTQYLTLTEERYEDDVDGLKYIMAPPLRKQEDIEALWEGIKSSQVDVIATDHCPFFLEEKMDGKSDFRTAPGGAPGVEERVEIVLSEGLKRGISIRTLVDKLMTRSAQIYGLYPRKGAVQVDSDADIIIIAKKDKIITIENRHSSADYTPYEGFKVDYVVEKVIQRGKVLVDNNKFIANKGDGMFLKRSNLCDL
ncbi:dihydropyrimidinase [Tepidimicrobium xylanilyticum]|uniref:Dihydropyrimidinase n=1 Tax=Tepidimicrobium xylanilyticum TaxID=1123352 RepID=A0A1H2SXD9_9FIRM|nr:dihydropyrimidinase [Tepidimicrobium xylanilyticum]SDW36250.1 dihydropyrimidinase [Tepidimicrobium xylanilyticum]